MPHPVDPPIDAQSILRVLAFESRRADEMRSLIERHGGVATIAPAMKEVPLGVSPELQHFLQELDAGRVDMLVFLTGVGAESLLAAVETQRSADGFLSAVDRLKIVVRGPKPFAVLKKWGLHIDERAPEPNTWPQVVDCILRAAGGDISGLKIAVQEYGQPSFELYAALEARRAAVIPVPVYRWALPDDIQPLDAAIHATIRGEFDVLLFTTAQQLVHVLQVAEQSGQRDAWLHAAVRCVIASIGPTSSERIREHSLPVDCEPEHPHMGHLVREAFATATPDRLNNCRRR